MTDQSKIRNFSIIAHIDHGKSIPARLMPCVGPLDCIQIAGSEFRQFQGFAAQNACTHLTVRQRGLATEVTTLD
jgi:hypothetical protein